MSDYLQELYGLLFGCPKQCEAIDCPMKEYRKDLLKSVDKLSELSDEEQEKIISHHKECTKKNCKKNKIFVF